MAMEIDSPPEPPIAAGAGAMPLGMPGARKRARSQSAASDSQSMSSESSVDEVGSWIGWRRVRACARLGLTYSTSALR